MPDVNNFFITLMWWSIIRIFYYSQSIMVQDCCDLREEYCVHSRLLPSSNSSKCNPCMIFHYFITRTVCTTWFWAKKKKVSIFWDTNLEVVLFQDWCCTQTIPNKYCLIFLLAFYLLIICCIYGINEPSNSIMAQKLKFHIEWNNVTENRWYYEYL